MWSKSEGVVDSLAGVGAAMKGVGDHMTDYPKQSLLNIPLWVPLVAAIVTLIYWYATMTFDTFEKLGIPYPRPIPFLGNMLDLIKAGNLSNWDLYTMKRFPGRIHGFFQGGQPTIQISDSKVIKQVTIRDFSKNVNRRNFFKHESCYVTKYSMTLTSDDHWRHVRGAIAPHFAYGKVKHMYPVIGQCGDKLVEHLKSTDGNPDRIKSYLSGYTVDVLLRNLVGIELDVQDRVDHPILENFGTLFGNPRHRTKYNEMKFAFLLFMLMLVPSKIQLFMHKVFGYTVFDQESVDYLDSILDKVLEETPSENESQRNLITSCRKQMVSLKDVPAHTIRTTDDRVWSTAGLLKEDVKANGMVLLAAGYEMTATAMQFLIYALATNPKVQQTLYEELRDEDEDISYERLQKLEYLDWCVNEALRMYPPVMRFDRVATEDVFVRDITIPKGMQINCLVFAMHRDPEYWPEPEVFKPERFSPEEMTVNQLDAFMPFGIGNRGCIGTVLAMATIKSGAFKMVRNFKIETTAQTPKPDNISYKVGTGFLQFEKDLILATVPRS